ncbi:Male sterility NAD-binding [Penicillium maclennaniae]|uniref:Male sterility NAD-binding n=1 Tax=Penicillium maclennaniae TaxID=1343394 RepID=UPI00253FBB1B|nr:Male sterility NAD-binding [Penicillium maclennaniae]KAJ5670583.1 Male sterility NAD-binding [Penicillium maclennaniae]
MGSISPQRTALRILDTVAEFQPDQIYCIHPVSSGPSLEWKSITFADLSSAINRMAVWIKKNVADSEHPQTLAYMGPNDIRYCIFVFACMRLRHTALLLSTRNATPASSHVMNATGCSKFVYSPERTKQIDELKAANPSLQTWVAPGPWDLFDNSTELDTVMKETSEDPENRVAVYIHSSGTTGLPKPVPMTNGYFLALEQTALFPLPAGRECSFATTRGQSRPIFVMSPFFHLMGILSMMIPVMYNTPFVLSPEKPLTAELLAQIVKDTNPDTSIMAPSILEDLSQSELGMSSLSTFSMLTFGGAPLAQEVGDRISEITHLQSVLGSSENAVFRGMKHQDKSDWKYLEWDPNAGYDMRDAGDGLFELVIPRSEDPLAHPIFHTYPDKNEYKTGDLFSPHPEKNGLWLYSGRHDDVIVLSNGEKFNPITMEEIISGHPLVSRALVVGQGRFQAGAIIEPNWSGWIGEPKSLIDEIWASVQKANATAPGHAKIMKNRIGVLSSDKRFERTAKGTVKRRATVNEFADELDALYAADDQVNVAQIPKDAARESIIAYITAAVAKILDVPTFDEHVDIFSSGLDSLQTLRLGQTLQASLKSALPELGAMFGSPQLYSRPTISQLSGYVLDLLQGNDSPPDAAHLESDADRETRISGLVGKYTEDFGKDHAVILTGSTGSLGAYLLHELLRDLSVTKIYCLNRSDDAAPRQLQSLREKGLAAFQRFPQRVEFLQAQFGAERLGLEEAKYEEMLESVDTIIHNAWKLRPSKPPHIEGVRRLVEFSVASENTAHIHFISSISTIEGCNPERGSSIPEIIFDEPSSALRQGYGESKHIAERICAAASAKCGVPTSIHRVGQISGPTTEKGMWNKQEWVPSLVATSKTIKQIPKGLGSVSVQWVPVDVTAKVITDIVRTRRETQEDEPCAAFHIVNPRATEWSSLVPAVTKFFDMEEVDIKTWIQTLESFTSPTESDLRDKPALKILDFFKAISFADEAGPWTATTKTQAASKTLRQLQAIDAPLMENWMKQWDF